MNIYLKKIFAFLAIPFSIMLFMDGMYEANGLLMAECIGIFIIGVCYLFPVKEAIRKLFLGILKFVTA